MNNGLIKISNLKSMNNSVVYSMTEKQIGWYEVEPGKYKPLYRKIIQDTTPNTTTVGTNATKDVNIADNIDLAFTNGGFILSAYGLKFPIPQVSSDVIINCYVTNSNKLRIGNNNPNYNGATVYSFVYYIKTIDQAISLT